MLEVAIIGGGLAGLSLAQQLIAQGKEVAVFEAADRFGGRILSESTDKQGFAYDLGPAWIWPEQQPRLARLVEEGAIEVFPQWLEGRALYQPERSTLQAFEDRETYASARRIEGGAYQLIENLLHQLPESQLHLGHKLLQLNEKCDHVGLLFDVNGEHQALLAKQVVLTLPPRLLANTVEFVPPLADEFSQMLQETPTWMAGHAKAVVTYPTAFWREAGYSGAALANYQGAALAEVFDACSADGQVAALGGFFALPATLRAEFPDDLEALVLEQLVRLFGAEAAKPESIIIRDWSSEPLTAAEADAIPPNYHPQYGHQWLQLDHWSDKLYFGGTETARQFGGYLEGALEAAERVARELSQ